MITEERLQEIKAETMRAKKDFIHGIPPRYTLLDNTQELVAAYETSQQQLAEMTDRKDEYRRLNTELREHLDAAKHQLAASQAEVKRLEDLYNSDRVKYLEDITLLQTEVAELKDMMMLNDPSNCANAIATDDGFLITIDKKKL